MPMCKPRGLTPASSTSQVNSRSSKCTENRQRGRYALGDAKSPTPDWCLELGRDQDTHGGSEGSFASSQPPFRTLTLEGLLTCHEDGRLKHSSCEWDVSSHSADTLPL